MAKALSPDELRRALTTCARAAARWAAHTQGATNVGVGQALALLSGTRQILIALLDRQAPQTERELVEWMCTPTSVWLPGAEARPILVALDGQGKVELSDYGADLLDGGDQTGSSDERQPTPADIDR